MFVDGVVKANSSSDVKKKTAKKSGGDFAGVLSGKVNADNSVNSVNQLSSVNSIFSIQEVGDESPSKSQVVQYGFDLVKYLETIHLGLLSGSLPGEVLLNMDSMIKNWRKTIDDPKLQSIIDEVELRSMVELAKLNVD